MNRTAKIAGWSALGLLAATLLTEIAAAWVAASVIRAIEEYEE